MSDLTLLKSGALDLWGFFQIPQDAPASLVRHQYRRLALATHPDKPGGSHEKFETVARVYEILSNEKLQSQYLKLYHLKNAKDTEADKIDNETKAFQDQLRRAEKVAAGTSRNKRYNLASLREEGLRKRQELEDRIKFSTPLRSEVTYVSYQDLPRPPRRYMLGMDSQISATVIVVWKYRPEIGNLFDDNVLCQIMLVFGVVCHASVHPSDNPDKRYETGTVEFTLKADAQRALLYNYKQSAKLWDGSPVRKLASLLRACRVSLMPEISTVISDVVQEAKKAAA